MIPQISTKDTIDPIVAQFIEQLKQLGFNGETEISYSSRLAVATDNSVYQSLPQAVLFPVSTDDVAKITSLAAKDAFSHITFSPRGGGTGTNGQSLTPGVVVDMSRHMREILEINVEEKWVRVQSGVIKDQLNDFLRPYGFFFSPDLSTSNRATIGGMVNTDASGQGSLVYGKTSDHVLGLKTILMDGVELNTSPIPVETARQLAAQDTVEGRIIQQVLESCTNHRELIQDRFPRLNRFLTGYDLEHVFDEDMTHFDLTRIITGSEGSLGFVTEAKLNLTPIPDYKVLVNIKYDSFESALRHSPALVAAEATSVETIDSRVLNLAKQDIVWHSISSLITDVEGHEMDGLNIVEYNTETQEEIDDKLARLTATLDEQIASKAGGVIGYQVTDDLASIGRIYGMRKKAVGLLGNTKGSAKPVAFAEDTAVPPESLADFIMEFRALLDSHKLDYGMFGHVDAGVLHVRPALDLCDPAQEQLMRSISDEVVALTAKYGGLMWGEHGKGYRSEYAPAFFGDVLYQELQKIKAVFDPDNRVNPGKICTPYNSDASLVSVDDTKRGYFDRQIPTAVKAEFEPAMNCNGNGLCFNYDVKSPMCPSYKITGDRRNSPKGRAGLIREWLRLMQEKGTDVQQYHQQVMSGKTTSWFSRENKAVNLDDFSHEVFDAMEECLACKACSSQCPVKVDVPDFRAKFLSVYYDKYKRPLKDMMVATVEQTAPLLAKFPRVANWLLDSAPGKTVVEQVIGYKDAPALSVPSLSSRLSGRFAFDFQRLKQLSDEDKQKSVIIVQDPFTSFYEAELVETTLKLLEKMHYLPVLLPFKPNGKPQHVKGFLTRFKSTAQRSADFLNDIATLGIPMIGLDASLVLTYRDEYKKVLGDARGDFSVQVIHEWMKTLDFALPEDSKDSVNLIGHCTEKTALPSSGADWQTIFKKFGLTLNVVSAGCCGMAGTYGHEQQNQQNSRGLYDLSWKPAIDALNLDNVIATGFSCRSQVKRFEGSKPKHPVEYLYQYL